MLVHAHQHTDYDVYIVADSDLVFHAAWFERLMSHLPLASSGVLSLYNSCLHKIVYCQQVCCRNGRNCVRLWVTQPQTPL